MPKRLLPLLIYLSLGLAARVGAQTSPPSATSGNTQVNLPSLPVKSQEETSSPAPTSSLSRAELQEVPPTVTGDMLTGLPGVFFQNTGAPGLAVSVRGLQDFGRVNVTIDGARQDFMVSGHGANSSVYMDPALLSGIDVSRGTVSTASGAGAIGGVVNLRTLGIDDVVGAKAELGFLTTDLGGTNGYDGSGMIAGGTRLSAGVDLLGALSVRSSGNYRDGSGQLVENSGQHLQSGLLKADFAPGADETLELGAIFYHNVFGTDAEGLTLDDAVDSTTATANYHFTPSATPLIDLNAKLAYTNTRLNDVTPSFIGVTVAPTDETHYHLNTWGGEIDNTSQLGFGAATLSINYGAESYWDREDTTDTTGNASLTPSGRRGLTGGFAQATFNWRPFSVVGAVRYDEYSLRGSGYNDTGEITALPAGPFTIDKTAGAASPKITLAVNPLASLQLYASYGLGFRPPALTETLMSGAHPGLEFLRFVPNPDLEPERTQGWEVGEKYAAKGLLQASDSLTFKVDYFSTHIRNYIDETLIATNTPDASTGIPIDGYFYENLAGTTLTHGVELEAEYDARVFFARLAYSDITTRLGTPEYTGFAAISTAPPQTLVSGTMGARFLGGRLTLGERTRAASRTTGQPDAETGIAPSVPAYVLEDLFATCEVFPNIRVFASVENVADREHFDDALATVASPGRTAKLGFTAQFAK